MPTTLDKKADNSQLPASEQAVVDDFTAVLRKHHDHAPGELARLVGLAVQRAIGPGDSRERKLVRAHLRGIDVRRELAETEGGSYSSEEVARLLQISKTAVLQRLAAGHLLAWREERLQAARFPRWQFDEHGRVLDGLKAVLTLLGQDRRLDTWGRILFFLQEKPSLDGRRPLDLLREGRLEETLLAARAYAE